MTGLRRSLAALRDDDQGVAGVVGFVLIIAAAVTYFAYVQQDQVPRWGAENEHAWDSAIAQDLLKLSREASTGSTSSVATEIGAPPHNGGYDIPLIAKARPVAPSGTLAFVPECGGVSATHRVNGTDITDIASGAAGCVVFTAHSTYTRGYTYRLEDGGVVRTQSDGALVLAGPAFSVRVDNGTVDASLALFGLDGSARSSSADAAAIHVVLSPSSTGIARTEASAQSASWTFHSATPAAWADWYNAQLADAKLPSTTNYACLSSDPRCAGLASDELRVVIGGFDPNAQDVSLTISYATYAITT